MPINIISTLIFLISPFLALPTILMGIIKKSKYALFLFIVFIGILSYLYVPNFSDDKSRYIEMYHDFKDWNYLDFILYNIANSQDFILQLLFKLAGDLEIKVQLVFFTVTVIVMSIYLKIWSQVVAFLNLNSKESLMSLILFVTSISFLDLFSGTRFMLASSFMLFAYFQGFFLNKKWQPLLFLFIAINIHFSLLIFAVLYFCTKLVINWPYLIKLVFCFSFIFLIVPKEILMDIFGAIGLEGALASKSEAYINAENDFVKSGLKEGGFGSMVIYLVQNIWIYAMYIYLLFRIKTKEKYHLVLFLVIAVLNIFYSIPTIYFRYSLFVKLFFVIILLIDMKNYNTKKATVFFIGCFICVLITQIIVTRNNIEKSYMENESLLFFDIISKKPMSNEDLID